jgi:hypothetical protein
MDSPSEEVAEPHLVPGDISMSLALEATQFVARLT